MCRAHTKCTCTNQWFSATSGMTRLPAKINFMTEIHRLSWWLWWQWRSSSWHPPHACGQWSWSWRHDNPHVYKICIVCNNVLKHDHHLIVKEVASLLSASTSIFLAAYITVTSYERCVVSSYWQLSCLPNSLFRPRTKETSKFCITGPLWRESRSNFMTEMKKLFWQNFNHCLCTKLSKWQFWMQLVIKISSKWQHISFSDIILGGATRKTPSGDPSRHRSVP